MSSKTTTICIAAILSLGVLMSPALANQYGDIVVNVSPPPTRERTHGYAEYRVSIDNRSLKDRHVVTLSLPQQSYAGGAVTRTITVEPSSTVNVSLLTHMGIAGNGLGIEIDGQPQREGIYIDLSSYAYEVRPHVLISQGASARGVQTRAGNVLKDPQGREDFYAAESETPVVEWSATWLGYSSYDGVILTADEMRSLPEPAATALIRYVECGGSLLVIGSWQAPKPWRLEKRQQTSALSTYHAGFGVCMVSENGAVEALTDSDWHVIKSEWDRSQSPWDPRLSMAVEGSSVNQTFPVTENVSIPVRGLLVIMLVFVIVIGPVNLLVLSRKKKRMWLLWTIPLISLLTCVAVSAYSVLSEGWGGRARYLSYTILDERSHHATTIGLNAFYSPLTPGDGLRFSTETEITSRGSGSPYRYGMETAPTGTVDWSDDQHLDSGWVIARTPAHFMIRRNETRRERLTLTRAGDGALSVVNGLGVSIRTLWLADEKGVIYQTSNVAAGSSSNMVKTELHLASGKTRPRDAFAENWISAVQQNAGGADLSWPRTYIAELDGCPFLEEGLKGVKTKRCEAVVYGIMKGPGDEN